MDSVTVVLVDDHPIVRQGARVVLEAQPGFRIVGEAGDGLEAVEQVSRLKPDVLVMDLMMAGLSGSAALREVRHRSPKTRVVILSMHADEAYVLDALRGGASAYVLKDALADELIHAVRQALAGEVYLSPVLSQRAVRAYVQWAAEAPADPYEALSPREREVLQLAAEGLTQAAIAARLGISVRTAEAHRASLMKKLGLRSQTDLVRYALRRGLLPPE